MTAQVSITLSSNLSERVRQLAAQRQEDIVAVVERILDEALPDRSDESGWIDLSEPDEAAEREMQAYVRLHPMLTQKYFGKYVAIYRGKLVDYDEDYSALYARIGKKHPDEFVWVSQVEEEPIRHLCFRTLWYDK